MAFTYGFYNSVNHDRKYDAVQMGQIFDGIITDGIYATYLKAMVVKASSNASEVIVQPGRAWFNHTWSYNDADYPVAAPEPEVVLDRIDTLVLDINAEDASRTNSFLWVQGTPTSQIPEPPTLIHTVTHNQYPLCDVYRQAGTTQIYAADITNRVGTSDCPFVTGVLEGIDIDDLLAQWDDEFHTWENATKASFEGWMVNQQSVYTAWWDALKAQMASDVEDVEAWIETIHDILDEEVATRLQAEIDEIKTELPSGSHVTVTTANTELYSRTVTITDEANHTVTSQFDATGVAVFKTVPYVGNLTISSTDGTRTATAVVQTPYFARYSFSIAFWSATVNIDGTSELGGETVTITDSSLALVGTVVLNASGLGVFNATYPDTYKFSVTHGGETMSVTLEVSQETTYNVEIHGGFNWQRWVDLSENYSSSDFNDLDELLADEKAVRELMTIHACVDYMADATRADANITQIINDDICAKWINDRDYALDTLYANSAIAAVMDTADKYFYGEWCLTPQVPKLTSNTGGNGTAFGNVYSQSQIYYAFDENDSTFYESANGTNPGYIGYHFNTPTIVKKFKYKPHATAARPKTFTIKASNDDTTYTTLGVYSITDTTSTEYEFEIENSSAYSYYKMEVTEVSGQGSSYYFRIISLQFYAYAPKGCVPVMTGNTAPYGEAIRSSAPDTSTYESYKAFDGDNSTRGGCANANNAYVGYKFTNPICPKKAKITAISDFNSSCEYKIKGSNDGSTWDTLASVTSASQEVSIDTDNCYLYLAFWQTYRNGGYSNCGVQELQFYGRQLSVSVPVMTSNTAPYGEAFRGESDSGTSTSSAFTAFDGPTASSYGAAMRNNVYEDFVGYSFVSPTVLKGVVPITIVTGKSGGLTVTAKVQASNNKNNWIDVSDAVSFTVPQSATTSKLIGNVDSQQEYKHFRVYVSSSSYLGVSGQYSTNVTILQFYGLDYSEKEFEAGTTKKWLYDHGVELETLSDRYFGVAAPIHGTNGITLASTGANQYCQVYKSMDLTNYDLIRAKADRYDTSNARIKVEDSGFNSSIAQANISTNGPLNSNLDISSIDQVANLMITNNSGASVPLELAELWLE